MGEGNESIDVYFACSISGGREHAPWYPKIVASVKRHANVLSDIFANQSYTEKGDQHITDIEIFRRDMNWLLHADAIVSDITVRSTGLGFEHGVAYMLHKPTLGLYHPDFANVTAMLSGAHDLATRVPSFTIRAYRSVAEIDDAVDDFFQAYREAQRVEAQYATRYLPIVGSK